MDLNFELSAKYILNTINQYSIFSQYFNIPEQIILDSIVRSRNIISPIRIDNSPSFGFKYSNKPGNGSGNTDFNLYGKLRAKDHAAISYSSGKIFWGDCFDAAGYRLKKNPKNPKEFNYILQHIINTFLPMKLKPVVNYFDYVRLDSIKLVRSKPTILFTPRKLNYVDNHYLNSIKFTKSILRKYFVYPVDRYWINRNPKEDYPNYRYKGNRDIAFAYLFGKDKDGIDQIEIYHPNRSKDSGKSKFYSNMYYLKGLHFLDMQCKDLLILTKSYKDLISISENIIPFFFYRVGNPNQMPQVLSVPTESFNDWKQIDKLSYFKVKLAIMDYDDAGKRLLIQLKKKGFIPLTFKGMGVKDSTEYINKFGYNSNLHNTILKLCHDLNYQF